MDSKTAVLTPAGIVIIHLITILLVFFPTIIVSFFNLQPYQRGFYCDDESIRYPFKASTIPFYVVGIVGFGIPSVVMALTEIFYKRKDLKKKSNTYSNIPTVVVNIYIFWGVFIFGAAFDQMITNSAKYLVGRPRPHFISSCNLDFSKVNCSNYNYVMIDNSICMETDPAKLKDMRLSFPSGHSSFSAYCAIAFSIYLIKRWMIPRIFLILRSFIQVLFIGLAVMCGLSRISDYKHHWSDVLAGFFSGTIVALATWCFFLPVNVDNDLEENAYGNSDTEMMNRLD